jgi:CO/xanthine dehydrogenase FAD-binding subunit|tara:strand:+ start:1825 stop:2622 length:798 start_codon:yes stop_codon:yes gene_type:complete
LEIAAQPFGKIVAGGTDVYPSAKKGVVPEFFLDLTRLRGFANITGQNSTVRIGAATTWSQIAQANLPPAFDALKQAAKEVGSVQIQNTGTIAGNICNASPAADGVPPLLALDAKVELASAARGTRVLALSEFLRGVRQTELADDELMTAIVIPALPKHACSAFKKLGSRRYLVISISMVAATITCDNDGRIIDARVAVGACSPIAQRLPLLERDIIGKMVQDIKLTDEHFTALSPIDDVRGSGLYRLDVVAEQCVRAIRKAAGHE